MTKSESGGTTIGPDGARHEVTLRQIAPGRYEGDLGTLLEGAHLLAIVARDEQGTAQAGTSGGLIVPYSPGGSSDTVARILGQKLGETLGQQFVIDNRPGASGSLGRELVA